MTATAIISSLRAGVVPRLGFAHIQVGRADEVTAIGRDLDRVADGGSTVRFVIGDYGAGKTFFLNLAASIAAEKKLVTAHADLTPDRRLHATGGQARGLYAELMRNHRDPRQTRRRSAAQRGGPVRHQPRVRSAQTSGVSPESVIRGRLAATCREMVGGYDFAQVIGQYWAGHDTGNDQLKADAIRWLRGEFTTKTDARSGARRPDYRRRRQLLRPAEADGAGSSAWPGSPGCSCASTRWSTCTSSQTAVARNGNYEQVLRIVNDCLQGSAAGSGCCSAAHPTA